MLAGAPAAMAGEDVDPNDETVHALDNGEELYLVFGAELGDKTLDEYIEAHASGEQTADAEVSQYQDVDQVNINQQGNAVSIGIDDGEATAIQDATQQNSNDQFADATAENVQLESTQFEDVGTVNVVIGNGDGKSFDGWGIADKKGDKGEVDADQTADAEVTQSQVVTQVNVNEQSVAFALADNESEATALQQSQQANANLQEGNANASNVYVGGGEFEDQAASASVEQAQDVDQANVNEQDAAVAIAVGENSTATAIQMTEQTNINEQLGTAEAVNALASMSGMHIATAGVDGSSVVDTEAAVEKLDEKKDEGHADEKADKHDDKKDKDKDHHKKGDGAQTATSDVTQGQEVAQQNINVQSTAMAIATDGSEAVAVQLAYQQNVNAQIAHADALNVYAGPSYNYDAAIQSETTSVNLGGEEIDGAPGIAYDADTAQTHDVEQQASAQIEQIQYVTQENANQQQAALAIADDEGSADAVQLSMQENENVQFTSVAATNVWMAA